MNMFNCVVDVDGGDRQLLGRSEEAVAGCCSLGILLAVAARPFILSWNVLAWNAVTPAIHRARTPTVLRHFLPAIVGDQPIGLMACCFLSRAIHTDVWRKISRMRGQTQFASNNGRQTRARRCFSIGVAFIYQEKQTQA
jgi:hypothetical protein